MINFKQAAECIHALFSLVELIDHTELLSLETHVISVESQKGPWIRGKSF